MVCLALIHVCPNLTLEFIILSIKSSNQVTIIEKIKLNINLVLKTTSA